MVKFGWSFPGTECSAALDEEAWDDIREEADRCSPDEAGGTLAGRHNEGMNTADVEIALVARKARRWRWGFWRPSDQEDGQLDQLFERSGGKTYYLGEWHSHPGGEASPSGTDTSSMERVAASQSVTTETPILLILGGDLSGPPDVWLYGFGSPIRGLLDETSVRLR